MTRPPRAIVALLFLSSLLVGLGHIVLLPPFDGLDETGHYSYIQQVVETGRWPRRGDRMSKDIDDYLKVAPTADSMYGPWTYYGFFSSGAGVIAEGRQAIQTPPVAPRAWAPGQIENWQAQHPPLYYVTMAPAFLTSKGWSLSAQLFFLRSVSYLMAWAGLCIVVIAVVRQRDLQGGVTWLPLALAAWPFLFPMWFPEMGRLGNDSLVTVFAACVFLLAWSVTSSARLGHHVLLGAVLGLGLLTKATFLPVTAAILSVLAVQTLRARQTRQEFSRRLIGLCATVAVMLAVSGWWYALKLIETGDVIGSAEAASMHESGGMVAGLIKNLRVEDFIMTPWGFVMSFVWGGTWSFIMPPRITYLPFVVMIAIIAYGATRAIRRERARPIEWFPLVALGFFFAALTYYSLVTLANRNGTSPAWYLHSMAPIVALPLGAGVVEAMRSAWLRSALTAVWFYPLIFLPAMTVTNLLYFAGCAAKLPGRNYFSRASAAECLADTPRMIEHLGAIASPRIGIALFVIGWVIAAIAMTMALRSLRAGAAYASTASIR
jgi:hypothetical protein